MKSEEARQGLPTETNTTAAIVAERGDGGHPAKLTGPPTISIRNVLARISVVVCELEIEEYGVAYQVARDLEDELDEQLRAAA